MSKHQLNTTKNRNKLKRFSFNLGSGSSSTAAEKEKKKKEANQELAISSPTVHESTKRKGSKNTNENTQNN